MSVTEFFIYITKLFRLFGIVFTNFYWTVVSCLGKFCFPLNQPSEIIYENQNVNENILLLNNFLDQ